MKFTDSLKTAREAIGVSQGEFARLCGWEGAQGRIGNYESGFREPSITDLKIMRSMLAKRGVSLPIDGLEAPISNTSKPQRPQMRLPVISWIQAGHWTGIDQSNHQDEPEQWAETSKRVGEFAFALVVRGDSMEPEFPAGSIIIVDPEAKPDNGDHIVALLDGEDEATFKTLVKDGARRYLRPINQQYQAIPIDRPMTVCGVVIQKIVTKDYK